MNWKPEPKWLKVKVDKFLKNPQSLRTSKEAKKILSALLDLPGWDRRVIAKRLKRTVGSIVQAMDQQGLKQKARKKVESTYSQAQLRIMVDYFKRPKTSKEESDRLKKEVVDKVNALRRKKGMWPVSFEAIRREAGRQELSWGRPQKHGKPADSSRGSKEKKKKEFELMKLMGMEPKGLSVVSLARQMKVSKKEMKKMLADVKKLLGSGGYDLKVAGGLATVQRRGLPITKAAIFRIKRNRKEIDDEVRVKPGPLSGIYYGSASFRYAALIRAFTNLQFHRVQYIMIVGGLVYGKALYSDFPSGLKGEEKKEWENFVIERTARELAIVIPRLKSASGKWVKIYINTSPVFDGAIGYRIAEKLTELRDKKGRPLREEIVFLGDKNTQLLPSIRAHKNILPAVPVKKRIPAKYASTSVQTQKERLRKVLPTTTPDLMIFGGYGVNLSKPAAGDEPISWITLPMCHRLSEQELKQDSESEVGLKIVKIGADDYYSTVTFDLKSFIGNERYLIEAPKVGVSRLQRKIIDALRPQPKFIGVLEDELGVPRHRIEAAIERLQRFRVGIVYNPQSKYYDFSPEWMQWRVRYPWFPREEFHEDAIVSLACMHALACHSDGTALTNYGFLCEKVPEFIIRKGVKILVGAGDFIQGLPKVHSYHVTGQIFQALGVLTQEEAAAYIVGKKIIGAVFRHRFGELQNRRRGNVTKGDLVKWIDEALLTFIYCEGNHDQWESMEGVEALRHFALFLKWLVVKEVADVLRQSGYHVEFDVIGGIVENHIKKDSNREAVKYRTPHGLTIKVVHPHTPRTKTLSITSEGVLDKYRDAQIVIAGNWHVAFDQQVSGKELGLRQLVEAPTMLFGTKFEDDKLKRTDFGINLTIVHSNSRKIYEVESGFYGYKDRNQVDPRENNYRLEAILKELELDKFSSRHR